MFSSYAFNFDNTSALINSNLSDENWRLYSVTTSYKDLLGNMPRSASSLELALDQIKLKDSNNANQKKEIFETQNLNFENTKF
jgi:hypothetical protein